MPATESKWESSRLRCRSNMMSNEDKALGRDSDYLTRREAQERLAAERSADLSARRVHQALAEQYAARRRTAPQNRT